MKRVLNICLLRSFVFSCFFSLYVSFHQSVLDWIFLLATRMQMKGVIHSSQITDLDYRLQTSEFKSFFSSAYSYL